MNLAELFGDFLSDEAAQLREAWAQARQRFLGEESGGPGDRAGAPPPVDSRDRGLGSALLARRPPGARNSEAAPATDTLSGFLSLPMDARPGRDPAVGMSELGAPVYRGRLGSRYTIEERPAVSIRDVLRGMVDAATDAPWQTAKSLGKGIAEGMWQGVSAPARALRGEPVTYGDVAATAMDWGLATAPGAAAARYDPNTLHMFAGPRARTADLGALERARRMAAEGVDPDAIWRATGWGQGADGLWRFEIDNSAARLSGLPGEPESLADVLQHGELHRAYPELRGVGVSATDEMAGSLDQGSFMGAGADGSIFVSDKARNPLSTVLHETQHAVQDI